MLAAHAAAAAAAGFFDRPLQNIWELRMLFQLRRFLHLLFRQQIQEQRGVCTVTFSSSAVLTSWAFSTEHVYDKVTVNGVQYSGSTGPDGVVASSMTWWSDGSVVRDGWKICQT